MKKDYMTATKKISTLGSFAGKSNTFSSEEIEELKKQPFTRSVGAFTPSQFKVSAGWECRKQEFTFLPKCSLRPFLISL